MKSENPSSSPHTIAHKLGMYGLRGIELLLSMVSFSLVRKIGRGAGIVMYWLFPSRRQIIARNLRIVLDATLSGAPLQALVKENMKRTLAFMIMGLKTSNLSTEQLEKHACITDKNRLLDVLKQYKSTICIVSHSNNWEILARIRQFLPEIPHWGSMYRKLDNPLLEEYIYTKRTEQGTDMFSKENGIRPVLRYVMQGGSCIGVLSDQFTQEGLFLPYFGKVTGTTPLPALLRKKTGAAYSGVRVQSTAHNYWAVTMTEEADISISPNPSIQELTYLTNKTLEKIISYEPLDSFWAHHRWKTTYTFAPHDPQTNAYLATLQLKPFRIVISVPEALDLAVSSAPFVKALKQCRCDMQINILCPDAQIDFWKTMPEVSHIVTRTENVREMISQMEAQEFYNDGPLDIAFILDRSKSAVKAIKHFDPVFLSGFDDHPSAQSAKFKVRLSPSHAGPPLHYIRDLFRFLDEHSVHYNVHHVLPQQKPAETSTENAILISPFTTLTAGDYWIDDEWKELASQLGRAARLIAMPQHEDQAKRLGEMLNMPVTVASIPNLLDMIEQASAAICIDGAIPALCAHTGTPTVTMYGSRLPEQHAPLGNFHKNLYTHTALMPFPASATPATYDAHVNVSPSQAIQALASLLCAC